MRHVISERLAFALMRWLCPWLLDLMTKSTQEVLTSLTNNAKLIGVLTYCYGDYNETPSHSAFTTHVQVANVRHTHIHTHTHTHTHTGQSNYDGFGFSTTLVARSTLWVVHLVSPSR